VPKRATKMPRIRIAARSAACNRRIMRGRVVASIPYGVVLKDDSEA
jgi:hypothetical protein